MPAEAATPPGTDPWHRRHRRLLGIALAVLATGMTVLWLVVTPEKVEVTEGVRSLAIGYGHPASWACLAALGLALALGAPRALRKVFAWSALVCCAAFLVALAL